MYSTSAPLQGEDIRIDPDDGVPRTFEEIKARYKGQYTEQELKEYWEFDMLHHEGEAIQNVAVDPFLTHAPQVATNPSPVQTVPQMQGGASASASAVGTRYPLPPEAELADVLSDPFLANPKYRQSANVNKDGGNSPFDTGNHGRWQDAKQVMSAARKHWTESFFRLLGPGDQTRDLPARNMLILGPWLVFMWVLLLWLLLRHFSDPATSVLTACVLLGCSGMMLAWYQGRRSGPISLLVLGALCLGATIGASVAGQYGWEQYWRQYWWTQTGFRGGITTAATPAMARADFAVINFWDDGAVGTYNDTRVDHTRGAGFKDTDYYCVAPILSPDLSGAGLSLVNFWAVGINCCQRYGAFTCDDSRQWNAGAGLVTLEGGYPCPTCNVDKFRAAVTKAEAVHGLVSANGARFVRWVKDTGPVETRLFLECFGYVLVCAVLAGLCCSVLGWFAWYYGVGIQMNTEDSLLAATEAALNRGGLNGGPGGSFSYMLDASSLKRK